MAKTPPITDPVSAVITAEEARLRTRLEAGGPLVQLEVEPTLAEYRRMALALRLAVTVEPPAADLALAPDAFVVEYVTAQLAKDAAVLASNAEGRAGAALRTAQGVWRGKLDAERRKQAWARATGGGGGGRP